MNSSTLIALELLLVLGLAFGFGIWQLASLRRERRRDEAARKRKADGDRSA